MKYATKDWNIDADELAALRMMDAMTEVLAPMGWTQPAHADQDDEPEGFEDYELPSPRRNLNNWAD
jgi:hypothetical protein